MREVLDRLADGQTLSTDDAESCFGRIMDGAAQPEEIAALLMAMRLRGETVAEITGAAQAMRARMLRVAAPDDAIDVCGTGGDGSHTWNISTAVTFVLAGMGIKVAKHGNRAATSRSGAADVLEHLGVGLHAPPEAFLDIIGQAGCGFLFAPNHHPALRFAADVRRALGFRTVFNLLGPLCNPAGVRQQLLGIYDPARARLIAEVLRALGSERAWVVHSCGMDELSLAGPSHITALRDGVIDSFQIQPSETGLQSAPLEALRGGDIAANAAALERLLANHAGTPSEAAYRDVVLLNAAAAAAMHGTAPDLRGGIALATQALASGAAQAALARLRVATSRWR